ncbi:MAG: YhdH/YhfP family quinone oxidoreductase [Desulfuromonadales bacterium]
MAEKFKAMIVEEQAEKQFTRRIGQRSIDDLPAGDLLVKVHYSSLNYKDALSATGNRGVTRNFPHTPGIDAAGEVVEDASGTFQSGAPVVVTGWDLGMNTSGGYGEYIRVPADWAIALPAGLSLRDSMILGTAGFTAGLSVQALTERVLPEEGPVLVTGATGGVGSVAVGILVANADRPMMKERWAGAVDVVGGEMLAAVLKSTRYGGTVTCCGLVGSPELSVNVFPFILRGVSLLGIDSVQCPVESRLRVWQKLAGPWQVDLEALVKEVPLAELEASIQAILKGELRGRVLVKI